MPLKVFLWTSEANLYQIACCKPHPTPTPLILNWAPIVANCLDNKFVVRNILENCLVCNKYKVEAGPYHVLLTLGLLCFLQAELSYAGDIKTSKKIWVLSRKETKNLFHDLYLIQISVHIIMRRKAPSLIILADFVSCVIAKSKAGLLRQDLKKRIPVLV
ncbi:hypothetical protein FGSG_12227 [Fusarium graminearum PH-1]|uniref:Chromosome 2, complete genome n=1 Tax=Gibberella zeae (strain ATCC MYA-4620 / CBS 123657 / FGSC 9075 / NRRL 31084 / PH-1) TaxID=229533 RepID=I1S5V6_GIBZE|nr:hypothetical protein FGSG_12227 [Fusarium graminearum PH-1]ESU08499.1 hypothetical protein FGSG_12227 [Fusarium graminearum PH-1]EYB28002.1 hypothetical protein FG05_12227 [Fusarium graminearum]CEF79620.1 unnamed protein product [Fusarium graminearum]|eukprot:XP_011320998.1 hypothetical protein FGSG_12227 [Fusarium graminearum PH-1]